MLGCSRPGRAAEHGLGATEDVAAGQRPALPPTKKGGLSAALLSFYFFSMADSTTMSSTYACDGASAGGFFTS